MKQFIVMIALLPILLFFPSQFVADEINHKKMLAIENIVQKYAQSARVEGCFTNDNIDNMKNELSTVLYIDKSAITFTGTTTPVNRTNSFDEMQMIYFKVEVPFDLLIAMSDFFNLNEEDKKINYTFEGKVPSELIN